MRNTRAFTMIDAAAAVGAGVAIVCLLVPTLAGRAGPRRASVDHLNTTQLRGMHQAMVIYAQSNNYNLPGLDAKGSPETNYFGGTKEVKYGGAAPRNRLWILLNGNYFTGDLCIAPNDFRKIRWTSGPVTTANYSFALLQIEERDAGRREEWRDNANSHAVLLSDRNTAQDNSTKHLRSLWTKREGDWKGAMVWGDNHAAFESNSGGFVTRYVALTSTADFLFLDGPNDPHAAVGEELGAAPGGNAFMVYY
jgi:hypothetical protein